MRPGSPRCGERGVLGGGAGEMGPRRRGVLCPRSGSLLPSALPEKDFLSGEAGVLCCLFSRTPGTIKEP